MNSLNIKINTIGKILHGRYKGWFIYVKNDIQVSGGYLILLSKDEKIDSPGKGYDSWAEDFPTVKKIFEECNWQVEWYK